MKRIVLIALFALIAGVTFANAQTAPAPGTGTGPRAGTAFVDANGDGICDNFQAGTGGQGAQAGRRGKGPGNGTGNQGMGPRDGSGYGARSGNGSGICDGTGPKGMGRRGGRQ